MGRLDQELGMFYCETCNQKVPLINMKMLVCQPHCAASRYGMDISTTKLCNKPATYIVHTLTFDNSGPGRILKYCKDHYWEKMYYKTNEWHYFGQLPENLL